MTGVDLKAITFDSGLARLARSGIPCFPCAGDKRPLVKGGFKAASSDPVVITSWTRAFERSLPAVPTGSVSGLFVVDCDIDKETGEAIGEEVLRRLGVDPAAHPHQAMTRSGGRHLFYRWHDGLPSSSVGRIGPGVDTRGEGAYVIAWDPDALMAAIRSDDVPDVPRALLQALQRPEPEPPAPRRETIAEDRSSAYALAALEHNAAELANAANGERNAKLNGIAYRMGRMVAAGWIGENAVAGALEAACHANGVWDQDGPRQCRATIRSGLRNGMAKPHPSLAPADDLAGDRATWRQDGRPVVSEEKGIAGAPWRRQNLLTMPGREFLYGRLLQRGKVTVTVAPGGVGKSALTGATEALAMATGRKLLHDNVDAPLRVWVWNLEEDQDELNRRLEAACVHFGIEGEPDGLFVNNGFDMPCRMAVADRTSTRIIRPLTDAIVAEVKRLRVDVLVIDPFVSTHFVNENDNGQIDVVAKEWARIANDGGCAVHLVHHTTKLRGFEATVESSRGASALVNAARVARALNPMTEEEASTYGLQEGWRYFRATDGKANYAPRLEASQWFAHASVHLPNGDNVGVVTPFTLPDAMAGVTVDHLDEVVRRAGEKEGPERYREAVQSPGWIGHMIAEVVGADLEVPADKKRVKASLAIMQRTVTFRGRRRIFLCSTPTVKGASRIDAAFLEGDQRLFHVPCPQCGEAEPIRWARIRWPKGRRLEAYLVCDACGGVIDEADKGRLLAAGEWRSTALGDGRTASFHLSALYSPFESWAEIALEHGASRGDPARLRAWVNLKLGEPHEDEATVPIDPSGLMGRREAWNDVPADVVLVTCGVDVQNDRLELELVGWGLGEESWSLAYRVLWGDPAEPAVWEDLDRILLEPLRRADGITLDVRAACIDTGGARTAAAYSYVSSRHARRVWGVKGSSTPTAPPWPRRPSKSKNGHVPLYVIGVSAIKEGVVARLQIADAGPGFVHFPADRDGPYFAGLTSERIVTRYVKGVARREWVKIRERNEPFDCRVYAVAALEGLKALGFTLEAAARDLAPGQPAPPPRVMRSRWMGR